VDPAGLYWSIERAATRSGLPVFVTENGIATDDDAWRVRYMHDHVAEAKRALDDGLDVHGFLYWSAFDNFEWSFGYAPTFGMVGIDRADGLRRVVRPSARWWERLCRTRTIPPVT
jgi:beta-glucosidase